MENNETNEEKTFEQELEETLELVSQTLQDGSLTSLSEHLKRFRDNFKNLYTIFIEKGLIAKDLYGGEKVADKIEIPSDNFFTDFELYTEMSKRLELYFQSLNFVSDSFVFDLEFLKLEDIEKIKALCSYIHWEDIQLNSENRMTRVMARMIDSLQKMDEKRVLLHQGSVQELGKETKEINYLLNILLSYKWEKQKIALRKIIQSEPFSKAFKGEEPKAVENKIHEFFSKKQNPIYYEELMIKEITEEDYTPESLEIRVNLIDKLLELAGTRTKKKDKQDIPSVRPTLIETFNAIVHTKGTLRDAAAHLKENDKLYKQHRFFFNLWEQILWILFKKEKTSDIYNVVFYDYSQTQREEKDVHFSVIVNDVYRIADDLEAADSGDRENKLELMTDKEFFTLLITKLQNLKICYSQINALDDFFKEKVNPKLADEMKGSAVELSIIHGVITISTQKLGTVSTRLSAPNPNKVELAKE